MSLEQSIADLQTQAGLLLDLPQDIADAAQARMTQLGNFFDARVNTLKATLYINQSTGNDNNVGDAANPLASIDEAISRIPMTGKVTCILQADYHFAEEVALDNRTLVLQASGSVRHNLTLERIGIPGTTNYLRTGGIKMTGISCVNIIGLTITIPDIVGFEAYSTLIAYRTGIAQSSAYDGIRSVVIKSCSVDIPANNACPLLGYSSPLILELAALTALDEPLTGKYLPQYTNTGGTSTTTIPWLVTTLTVV